MFPTLFKIGNFTLHTYGLFVALGFLISTYFVRAEFERRNLNLGILDRIILLLMLAGIFGARLFYVFFSSPSEFMANPLSFFRIWEGGLVFYGGLILGALALIFYCKKKKLPLLTLMDAFAAPLFLAHAIGRLGCFSAGCCYGKPTDSFLGVTFSHPESLAPLGQALLPTQLFAAIGNFILFLVATKISLKKPKPGTVAIFYLISYGCFRFVLEFFRNDFRGPVNFGLYPSQWISLGLILAGLTIKGYEKRIH